MITTNSNFTNPLVNNIQEEEINIKGILYKYLFNHTLAYLLFSILSVSIAYLYLQYTLPIYEVKSQLLIKEDNNEATASKDMLLKELRLYGTPENVANEIHILNSISLMEAVVEELNLEVTYHWNYLLKEIPVHQNFPILVDSFSLTPAVKASEAYRLKEGLVLQIEPVTDNSYKLIHKKEYLGKFSFGDYISTDYGDFNFSRIAELDLNSDSLLNVTFKDPELVTDSYSKNLIIKLVDKESSIVELKLEDTTPLRAKDILQKLVDKYNQSTINGKNKITENTLKFINTRLLGINKDLSKVENSVEKYKKINEISSTSEKDLEMHIPLALTPLFR